MNLFIFSLEHFGEYVPPNSGLLSVIKAHGYFNPNKWPNYGWSHPEDLLSEILLTEGNAVLLIRNPYRAFYSYRNHIISHLGHANMSEFFGSGNLKLSTDVM